MKNTWQFIDRTGEEGFNKFGTLMKIIKYNKANDIIVEFQDEYKAKVHTKYCHFKNGSIRNPYDKEVCNIGYLGDEDYKSSENGKSTKVYETWRNMLKRCYDPYELNKEPTYIDCTVCKEWHCFQNFARWYEENYYEIKNEVMCLDKDILIKGNKIYSPATCVFVPQRINNLFTKSDKIRGEYPIGVTEWKERLSVKCSIIDGNGNKKRKFLGYFPIDKINEAFNCYKIFKEKYIKQIADEYKDLIPQNLYNALYSYRVEIND